MVNNKEVTILVKETSGELDGVLSTILINSVLQRIRRIFLR